MRTRELLRLPFLIVGWALMVLLVACGHDGATSAPSLLVERPATAAEALVQAATLATPLGAVAERLAPTPKGWVAQARAARSASARAVGDLHATLPSDAAGSMTTGAGPGDARTLGWALDGASAAAALELDQGRAIYREAFPSTDFIVTAEPSRVETFFLLHDAAAPSAFTWTVALPAALTQVRREPGGGLAFADAQGQAHLRVGGAVAVDAAGETRAATLGWDGARVTLEVDPRGLVYPILVDPPIETVQWDLKESGAPGMRSLAPMVYDSARGKVVLFGGLVGMDGAMSPIFGADTWEWDGVRWTQRLPVVSPPARGGHVMAYDSVRKKVVLFGGQAPGSMVFLNDTWEWDGTTWTKRTSANGQNPTTRTGAAAAYDSGRKTVVLFGGFDGTMASDTWEWDGTSWAQRLVSAAPSGRYAHGLAYDGERKTLVLFGGSGLPDETWELATAGGAWVKKTSALSPPARSGFGLAFDATRKRVVAFGGGGSGDSLNDTWEWSGSAWTARTLSGALPSKRKDLAFAYDSGRQELVLFGGSNPSPTADTWVLGSASSTWAPRLAAGPGPRLGHALAYDVGNKRSLLFGGGMMVGGIQNDTWEWSGSGWLLRTPSVKPSARYEHALVYDDGRARVLLFGGLDGTGARNDAWEWNGSTWAARIIGGTSPEARSEHALAYDSDRSRVVLFGGQGSALLNDTWEINGLNWEPRAVVTKPAARRAHALAYDKKRKKVVLFGGVGPNASTDFFGDTWEWDGSAWAQRTLVGKTPPARYEHALVYDSARGKVVLFGGRNATGLFGDTWEFDGTSWVERVAAQPPSARAAPAMAYDSGRGKVVLFGGGERIAPMMLDALRGDTWEYGAFYSGACSTDAECGVGGHCVDAVCCDSACGGGDPKDCLACSKAAGAAADGVCGPRPKFTSCSDGNSCTGLDLCDDSGTCAGQTILCAPPGECQTGGGCDPATGCVYTPKPAGAACSDDGKPCTEDACDGAGACAHPAGNVGLECRAPSCASGVATLAAKCSGAADCPAVQTQVCAPFLCGATACDGDCALDADCAPASYCAAGICEAQLPLGQACGADNQCLSGACVDGVCCDGACDGACMACDVAGLAGTCSPVTGAPHGARSCGAPGCANGTATVPGACDQGACEAPTTVDCAPYVCGATDCKTDCTVAADCAAPTTCQGGACTDPGGTGGAGGAGGASSTSTASGGASSTSTASGGAGGASSTSTASGGAGGAGGASSTSTASGGAGGTGSTSTASGGAGGASSTSTASGGAGGASSTSTASGGAGGASVTKAAPPGLAEADGGCGCREAPGAATPTPHAVWLTLVAAAALARRRRAA